MNIIVTTKTRKYDFSNKIVTSIVERKSRNIEGLVWLVLKIGDDDLAKFKLDEVEAVLFKNIYD